jgi:tRNA-uridine 2-sulfurtransferase
MPELSGELVTAGGKVVGRHAGIHGFTVGQRKGLGQLASDGQGSASNKGPQYVLAIHPDSHRVTIGSDDELMSQDLVAGQLNWVSMPRLDVGAETRLRVKIRHRHEPAWAALRAEGADRVRATFDEPQRAVTPGQAAVFYDGDEVAGGGWIV